MTYVVKRIGTKKLPKVLKNTFSSYDEARNAIRKWLRSRLGAAGWVDLSYRSVREWDNRTVNIGKYGFGVVRSSVQRSPQS